ncbi:hypothetical protein BJ741DRAFT_309494 [Chytriomyces cf. hyalinus JEL632]|nr:hypothetical protein BJ741DRAFT_309494 [Chytriomyces cf. hyalinus JEL632]
MDSHEPRLPPRNRKAILTVVTRFYKEGGILEKDVVPASAAPVAAPAVVRRLKKDVKKDVKKVGNKGLKRTAEEISDDEKTPAEEPAVVEVVASEVKSPASKSAKKGPIAKVEEPKEEEVAVAAPSKKMKKHPLAEVVAAPTAGKKDKAAVKAAASAVIKKKAVDVSRKEVAVAVAEPAKPKRNIELRMDKNKIKTFNKLKPIGMIPIDISKASPSKSALKKTQ